MAGLGNRRPSPAMIVACIGLAISLSGVAYAQVVPSANSVGTKQLRANAVTGPKVRNNSLTGLDVREATLAPVPSAANASNAQTLDALDSTAFLRAEAAAGGVLTGTYPNPGLADGAVTNAKLAAAAVTGAKLADSAVSSAKLAAGAVDAEKVTDGSLRLIDLAVWSVAGNIGGTTTVASDCNYFNFGTPTGAQPGDLILVRSAVGVPAGLALSAVLRSDGGVTGGTCNFTTANVSLPNPFVLTIYGVR